MKIYQSFSSEKTKKIGESLAKKILKLGPKEKAVILSLIGDLGSGKTTFAQGFLSGLGVKKRTTSPTFILFRRFALNDERFKNFYHMDCYRLVKPAEILALGFEEIVNNPQNIVLIEWAERIAKILPRKRTSVYFEYGKQRNQRKIGVSML